METILLVLHALVVGVMILVILIQPPASEGIGMGSGSSSLFSARGKTTALTRTTAILATIFMVSSLILSIASVRGQKDSAVGALMEEGEVQVPEVPDAGNPLPRDAAPQADVSGEDAAKALPESSGVDAVGQDAASEAAAPASQAVQHTEEAPVKPAVQPVVPLEE